MRSSPEISPSKVLGATVPTRNSIRSGYQKKLNSFPSAPVSAASATAHSSSCSALDADVVPCFQLHRYDAPYKYVVGHRIFPKSGGYVDNHPKQNYDNGVAKNTATGRRYKEVVRCVKRLVGELYSGRVISRDYPGYLLECLVSNVPNERFGHNRRYDDLQSVFRYLWNGLEDEDVYLKWHEPSRLKMLFRDPTGPGARQCPPEACFSMILCLVICSCWDQGAVPGHRQGSTR